MGAKVYGCLASYLQRRNCGGRIAIFFLVDKKNRRHRRSATHPGAAQQILMYQNFEH